MTDPMTPLDARKLHEGAVEKAMADFAFAWSLARREGKSHAEMERAGLDFAIRAYLRYVADAGFKVAPAESDQAMIEAGLAAIRESRNIWRAMHAAAPPWPPVKDDPPS